MIDLDSLNINQRRAVQWDGKPLLVLAGPGSGKTRVLTTRVARLLIDSPDESFRILGLTFTCKAAAEMRSRVNELVPPEAHERALLTTFHSFCGEVLRQHGSHVGVAPDFKILAQQGDREAVLLDAIHSLQGRVKGLQDSDVNRLPALEALLDQFVADEEVGSHFRDRDTGRVVGALYKEYRRQLLLQNCVDYPSLLFLTFQLLSGRPAVARQLRTVYRHLCVDEFQDTNLAQYQVLRLVAGENPKNLFVVADDDQIIYQWTGACPERLAELRDDYEMEVIQLPTNYRCPPDVIGLANNLIQCNLSRSPDKEPLVAAKPDDGDEVIRVLRFDTLDEEVAWVAADIEEMGEASYGRCVVLARNKKLLEEAASALTGLGITAVLPLRKDEFESSPFRWLHSVLRLANARSDREQLRRVCKAFYELEGLNIRPERVAGSSLDEADYLRDWLAEALARDEMESDTRNFLEGSEGTLVARGDYLTFISAALSWFEALALRSSVGAGEGFTDYEEERSAWLELQAATLDRYGRDQTSLQVLLQEFDLSPKAPPVPPDAVRCYTIHTSKGMEFPHVYLIGLVEEVLPSFQSMRKGDASAEMEEERRNCFVAITRTQESLTLTHSRRQGGWPRRPSRFLAEMGLEI